MLEPLGQAQVLAYLEQLVTDVRIHLLSFEKKRDWFDKEHRNTIRTRIEQAGIIWHPLRYHKTPTVAATSYDIARAVLLALWLHARNRFKLIHARSYVSATVALVLKQMTGAKFLFDMRGFWADERIDGELWSRGSWLYRVTKHLERYLLRNADHVVTLTSKANEEITRFPYLRGCEPPMSVIPTCADLDLFSFQSEPAKDPFTFGHVGSTGTWYLFGETLAFFKALEAQRSDARFLIVTRDPHDRIRALARRQGIADEKLEIIAASHSDVPKYLARMHAAAAIIRPVYSKMASAPTKLAEYLGCGVPCVGNRGVGDMEEILEGQRVGVVLTDFSPADHESAAKRLLALVAEPEVRVRCANTAQRYFSLKDGARAYLEIYKRLL